MKPARIGFVHTGNSSQLVSLADPAVQPFQMRDIYLPDATAEHFADLDALVVADRSHPSALQEKSELILGVAEQGGTVVVLGENVADRWLPGVSWESRPTNFWWWRTGEDHGMRRVSLDHDFWNYFTEISTIWHHHGFFNPPEGAQPLTVLEENGEVVGAITYLDEVSTRGKLLVTTMDPCFHHGAGFMPGATQLYYSALRWIDAQVASS